MKSPEEQVDPPLAAPEMIPEMRKVLSAPSIVETIPVEVVQSIPQSPNKPVKAFASTSTSFKIDPNTEFDEVT
jgi:hypothetical protein